ncbi:MAG: bifunctional UDP-N-acetylmuramoyl-tripeptide:D-alanyl-D-alanine ligase/alanine racemase [Chitinophagaceae bacterium]
MKYSISHIAHIIEAVAEIRNDQIIEHLILDSRKISTPAGSLFFAMKGLRRDGHQFIPELYKKGVRNFIVCEKINLSLYPEANCLQVDDPLLALQQLVALHRNHFNIPVIGITGSNGKTVVKEWLYQLLHEDYDIVRSPKSYNSQIGVPLSIWPMNEKNTLGIFEAGISEQGEMLKQEKMIRPTIGVLTNIGEAHSEGFNDPAHKFREKLALFRHCKTIIGREKDFSGQEEFIELLGEDMQVLTWGSSEENKFVVRQVEKQNDTSKIVMKHDAHEFEIIIPLSDDASIENSITCCCVLLHLGIGSHVIQKRMMKLQPVNMRLELKKGINHCSIINDSYSADLSSLEIALNFLDQQSRGDRKTVILSDFLQSALPDDELYFQVIENIKKHNVARLIGIGERISAGIQQQHGLQIELYPSTENFVKQFRTSQFKEETILIKGARMFAFEQIVQLLEQKVHQTILEINLNAIIQNLKSYQALLKPSTKVMAMVKAFAYGSGGAEIAGKLQYHNVDYLGVAYADEGVELRKAGINIPIMVMNPDENAFESIAEYQLEPEIYSFELLNAFDRFLQKEGLQQFPVHIEIETGMNRLGFASEDMEKLSNFLLSANTIKIQTVFSHLAASEEAGLDEFTMKQFTRFQQAVSVLQKNISYPFLSHIANSAAIARHPQLQMDMVRLGIGLYGIDSTSSKKLNLQTAATLRSTVAQIKFLKKGESVSYNRQTILTQDSVIATIRIGYADGYPRRLGNGIGKIWIKGKLAPVVGAVCMDMIMVDVTQIPGVAEGDEVIIFGNQLPVQQLATWAGTIPYEIMTGISQRVKRIFFEE